MIAVRVRVHEVADLGTLAAAVAHLAGMTGLTQSQAYRLRLAAEEIVTNVLTHGYGGRGGSVDIDAGCDDEWVWLRIEDDAPEFDPLAYDPAPRLAMEARLAPLGGFGLFLTLSSVDRLEHTFVAGRNRNVLMIRRRRPNGPAGDGGTHGEVSGPGGG